MKKEKTTKTLTSEFIEALKWKNPSAVEDMIEEIPNLDFSSSLIAENPLFLTACPYGEWSRLKILSKILDAKCPNLNLNMKNEDGFELFEILLSVYFHLPVNTLDAVGDHIQEESIVSHLLSQLVAHPQFDVNTTLKTGHTPLMYCLMDERMLWLAKQILSIPTLDTAKTSDEGYSAYGIAIVFHNKRGLDELKASGMKPNDKDKNLLVTKISDFEAQNNAYVAVGRPAMVGYLMDLDTQKCGMIRIEGDKYYDQVYKEELVDKQHREPHDKPYAMMEGVDFFKYPDSQNTADLQWSLNPFFASFVAYMEIVFTSFDATLSYAVIPNQLNKKMEAIRNFEVNAPKTSISQEEVQDEIINVLNRLWDPVWGEENGSSEHVTEYINSSDLVKIYKTLAKTNDKVKKKLQKITEEVQESIDQRIEEGKKPYRSDVELMEYIKA